MKRLLFILVAIMTMAACTESDEQINKPNDSTEQPEGGNDDTDKGDDEGEKPNEGENDGEKPNEGENEGDNNGDDEGEKPNEGDNGGEDKPGVELDTDLIISVAFEGNGTRVHLDQEMRQAWNEGDILSVFFRTPERQQWQFQGSTGDHEGVIMPIGEVQCPATEADIVVLYPDSEAYIYDTERGSVYGRVEAKQEYAAGGYGKGGALLVAKSREKEMLLRNIYGWLRIELTGDNKSVASIMFTGNNNEQLTGEISINPEDATTTFTNSPTAGSKVTLLCEGGVALDSTTPTAFYIGLVPQEFNAGATIVIEDTEGGTMTLNTEQYFKVSRNTLTAMSCVEYTPDSNGEGDNEGEKPNEGEDETDDETDDGLIEAMYPPNTSIWYNTPDGTQLSLAQSPTDAAITNHNFGACANGSCYAYYTIDFDAEVTEINASAFYASTLEIIFIPTTVREIGSAAFASSKALTTVHLGRKVKSIGDYAFTNCDNLEELYIRATTPPALGDSALLRDDATAGGYAYIGAQIYVPMEAVEAYKEHTAWKKYADYIVGYEYKYITKNM